MSFNVCKIGAPLGKATAAALFPRSAQVCRRFATASRQSEQTEAGKGTQHQNVFKKYIRGFFRKVHPDFFHQFPEQQQANHDSLQTLNTLLASTKYSTGQPAAVPPSASSSGRVDLLFYTTQGQLDPNAKAKFPEVRGVLDLSQLSRARTESQRRLLLEKSIEQVLLSLFRQSGVEIDPRDQALLDSTAEEVTSAGQPAMAMGFQRPMTFAEQYQRELRKTLTRYGVTDNIVRLQNLGFVPTTSIDYDIDHDMVFAEQGVTAAEREHGLAMLEKYFPVVNANVSEKWTDLPIVLTHQRWGTDGSHGVLMFPYNFQPNELVNYLRAHVVDVRARVQQMEAAHFRAQQALQHLRGMLGAADVLADPEQNSSEVVACVARLLEVDLLMVLSDQPWAKLSLVIGGTYNIDPQGHVTVPVDFKKEELLAFLEGSHLDKVASHVASVHQSENTVQNLLGELKERFGVNVIRLADVFARNFNRNARTRQLIITELERLRTRTSSLDLSPFRDFTLLVSNRYFLDLDQKVLELPLGFTAKGFGDFLKTWQSTFGPSSLAE